MPRRNNPANIRDERGLAALRDMEKGAPWKIWLAETLRCETALSVGECGQLLPAGVRQTLGGPDQAEEKWS